MSIKINGAAQLNATVSTSPSGAEQLHVKANWSDQRVHDQAEGFDKMEEMYVRLPVQTDNGLQYQDFKLDYVGTSHDGLDQHAATIDLASAGIKLSDLQMQGISAKADTSIGEVWVQDFNQNAQVHDVGRVDQNGVAWAGNSTVTHVSGRHLDTDPLQNGDKVSFSAHQFGRPGNIQFDMEVFAPGQTSLDTLSREEQWDLLDDMDVHAESPFFPDGEISLDYLGSTGPDGNNIKVGWQLADPGLFQGGTPATGEYPVRMKVGDKVISEFILDWKNE